MSSKKRVREIVALFKQVPGVTLLDMKLSGSDHYKIKVRNAHGVEGTIIASQSPRCSSSTLLVLADLKRFARKEKSA